MKRISLVFCLAAAVAAAQTAPSPSAPAAKTSTATTAKAPVSTATPGYKLPPGFKRIATIPRTAFSLKYQDIKLGTGPAAESNKLWHVNYTGFRAVDGVIFDASADHKQPVMGKDGKPELGPDGKPKMGEAQPMAFPQGMGRLIPGFDYGVVGMHVGGKRRLFIPWQMAYGTRAIPDRPDHPGIPAKSDLIFDVELVEVTELPTPPQRPGGPGGPGGIRPGSPGAPGSVPRPGAPSTPPPAGAPPAGAPGTPSTPPPSGTAAPQAAPGTPPPAAATPTPPPATKPPAPTTPPPATQPSTPPPSK
jgi:peptidylprolyl isomerase